MTLKTAYRKYDLKFNFDARTSRGSLQSHTTFFVKIFESKNPTIFGIGEAAPLEGLSIDFRPDFEIMLQTILQKIEQSKIVLSQENIFEWVHLNISQELPAIRFAIETALLDLMHGGKHVIFPSAFTKGDKPLIINGLIWIGNPSFMLEQIEKKLAEGFSCIKMKIGALDFEQELQLLHHIRERFPATEIVLRVDANGAFKPEEALQKLDKLATFQLHSIEQPIAPRQLEKMQKLCEQTPIPIALDEELIGISDFTDKNELLAFIKPHFIILKPTLLGGFRATQEWIRIAENQGVGWWLTSALEANVGLSAISQFTATFNNPLPQGLGTGSLYHNNIDSSLKLRGEQLWYIPTENWENPF